MDMQDLKISLQNIENRCKREKIDTIKTYCDANNPYQIGDTFTDHNCTIRIENIRYYCSETNPCCIYEGVILRKDGTPRKLSRFARLYPGFEIKEILAGHLHTYSANSEDNLPVYRLNSLCSPDEYAIGLGLSSEPGARLITYGKQGRVCDRLIRFSE